MTSRRSYSSENSHASETWGNDRKGFLRTRKWVVVSFPRSVVVSLNVDLGAELLNVKKCAGILTFPLKFILAVMRISLLC